jgi:ferrochelatase
LAVVLFNLGGPDSPEAIEPFLRNLFSDPAILSVPGFVRVPLARFIARRRAPIAREIYAKIGGRSPILEETQAQAHALDAVLQARGLDARSFIAMRCSPPFSEDCVREVARFAPEKIVLLPLYPQFSTTTTASSFAAWNRAAAKQGLNAPTSRICCYPQMPGFVSSVVELVQETWARRKNGLEYRLLLSAHGLPERTIARGDPYQWQVEQSAAAIVDALGISGLDARVCYQSRVGPLKWIGPATDAEIRHAGADGKGVVIAPIAFVSEHSETLVELDIEYAHLAASVGVVDYLRVPAVRTMPAFVEGLADLVERSVVTCGTASGADGRICPTGPTGFRACAMENAR